VTFTEEVEVQDGRGREGVRPLRMVECKVLVNWFDVLMSGKIERS